MFVRTALIAGFATLSLSGAAFAQSNSATLIQQGRGTNVGVVSQAGRGATNSSFIAQDGKHNIAATSQVGKVNSATTLQLGAKTNFASTNQVGKLNDSLTVQQGSRSNFSSTNQIGGPRAVNTNSVFQIGGPRGSNTLVSNQFGRTNAFSGAQLGGRQNVGFVSQLPGIRR
jgi:hypothetical protein